MIDSIGGERQSIARGIQGKRIVLDGFSNPNTPQGGSASNALNNRLIADPSGDVVFINRVHGDTGASLQASGVSLGRNLWDRVRIPLQSERSASLSRRVAPHGYRLLDSADALKKMSAKQLEALPPEGLMALTLDQWARLPKETLAQLTPYQVKYLSRDSAALLSCEQLNALNLDDQTRFTPYQREQRMLEKSGLKPQWLEVPLVQQGPLFEQAADLKGKVLGVACVGSLRPFYAQDVSGVRPATKWVETTRIVCGREIKTQEHIIIPDQYEVVTFGLDAIPKGTIRSGRHEGKTAYYTLNAGRQQSYIVNLKADGRLDLDFIGRAQLNDKHVFCMEVDRNGEGLISAFYDKDGNFINREPFNPHALCQLEWEEHAASILENLHRLTQAIE